MAKRVTVQSTGTTVMICVPRLLKMFADGIRRNIEEQTGREVSAGAIYTALGRLENRGFVTSRIGETAPERSGQRRKYYSVQPEGAAALYRAYSNIQSMAEGLIPQLAGLAARARRSDENSDA